MHVLLLPGPTRDADEVRESLVASRPGTHVEVCEADRAVAWLAGNAPCDMVVVDAAHLGDGDASLLPALRAQRPGLPIAVLVAAGDAPAEARALLAGADASVASDGHGLDRLAALLMHNRRRDVHTQRRGWRLWFAGRDTELRRQLAGLLGDRVLLMSLAADGRLVPKIEEPSAATALIVDGRERPGEILLGLRRVREAHPSLATIVVADERHHVAFLGLGADDCLPPGADVERILLAVDRLVSARQVAAEVVALRARENRLRALVEYLPDPVVLVSPARTVLAVNLAGLELLGAEEAQHVIGRELSVWLTPEVDGSLDAFVDAVSAGTVLDQRAATRHATAPRPVTLRGVPFQREPGKPSSVLVVIHETVATAPTVDVQASPDDTDMSPGWQEIEALRAQVASLSHDIAVAHEAVQLTSRRNVELEADVAARVERERRQAELVASLEHDLEVQRTRADEHARAVALTGTATTALEHLLADEHARAAALVDIVGQTREALARANVRIATLEAEERNSTGERQRLREQVSALEQRLAQAEARVAASAALEQTLASLRTDREDLVDALAAAQHDAGVHGAAHAEAAQRAEVLSARLTKLEREYAERMGALSLERDALRQDVGQLQALRTELPTLREAQRRVAALEGQLSETQMVRAQALALESEVSELRDAREQARRLEAELARTRAELEARPQPPARLEATVDEETRWLLYEVASIGHLTTTPDARILGANDMAAQLLGHFSRDALQASGRVPDPLLLAAGAFAHRPARFEVCLQHGDEGPLHWIVGLATPHAGVPATVTWMLIDVSEQRLQARRSRFLRRMEAMTHVLSAATAESSTLLERVRPLLDAASDTRTVREDVDVEAVRTALARTHAVLTQLSGFARIRARRAGVRDVRTLLDQTAPVLVHVAGEDIACTIETTAEPLHATLEPAEFEQFVTALVMAGRDALPLGGRLTLGLSPVNIDTRDDGAFFMRPSIELVLRGEGYGAQMPDDVTALQERAQRLGGTLVTEFDGRGEMRIVVRLARVFVTQ